MNNDVVIYQSSDGLVKMEAIVDASNETIWATQKAMAELFGVHKHKHAPRLLHSHPHSFLRRHSGRWYNPPLHRSDR